LDCGYNQDYDCPECGEEPLPISYVNSNDNISRFFSEPPTEDKIMPLFSVAGFDFFLFAPPGMSAWAILSLLLTLTGIILSLLIIIRAARQNEYENIEFNERTAVLYSVNSLENVQLLSALENEERFVKRHRFWSLVILCFFNFFAVLLLVLMQDFRGIIVLLDWWVIVHAILFAGIITCGKLVFRKYEFEHLHDRMPSLL